MGIFCDKDCYNMSLLDFFKKKKKQVTEVTVDIEELYENGYPFQQHDIEEHASLYSKLDNNQRGVILVTMDMFAKSYIIADSDWGDLAKGLLKIKSDILGITTGDAWKYVQSAEDVHRLLCSIKDRKLLDILLLDMQFLLRMVVNLTMRYKDGVEVNRNAINALYGIFIPLGYSKSEVFNQGDFMMF